MPILSGVPQGSVLAPLLFVLFINDVPSILSKDLFKSKLFADVLKGYDVSSYRLNPDIVQIKLDTLIQWCKTWQLNLSLSKCGSLMLCGHSPFNDNYDLHAYSDPINTLEDIKDLGVFIDKNLSLTKPLNSVICKAKQRIYLIFKSFVSRNIKLLIAAYKTYILPILDYCSSVWSAYKLTDIDRIENVQRYFTKRLSGLWYVSYSNRLSFCSLVSLELRRLITDLVLCFKIVYKLIALNFNDFLKFDNNKVTRGHSLKLCYPLCRLDIRLNFFAVRVVKPWNSLPESVVTAGSVSAFKCLLKCFNLSKFLKRNCDMV